METKMWVNIGSGNGLLLYDDTKPLPVPMLTIIKAVLRLTWEEVLMNLTHNID